MKRKNWVSIACGGLLILATALPATAGGWDLFQPRPAVLELVMDWFAGWVPDDPNPEKENRFAAGKKDEGSPDEQTVGSSCEGCNQGEITVVVDPDG